MTSQHEVYITGLGLIAPSGHGGADFLAGLPGQDSNFAPWPEDQPSPGPHAVLGLARDFPVAQYFTERQLRMTDRAMVMATCAVGAAMQDAGIETFAEPDEVATLFGTMRSEHSSIHRFSVPLHNGKPKSLNAAHFPMIARNIACGQVALQLGLRGMSSMICNGPLSSLNAIARAADLIRRGRIPVAVVGGIETLSGFSINLTRHLYGAALQGDRPSFFDRERGLLVPAEGAAALILESAEHAARRGAAPYARIAGTVAGRLGRDEDAGAAAARMHALLGGESAGRAAWSRVGLISTSQSGCPTPASTLEAGALAALYERFDVAPALTAVRSWVGESESVAAAVQLQAAALALKSGRVPPTRAVAAALPTGLNVAKEAAALKGDEALVSGFDDARNYSFLRLAAVSTN